MGLVNPLNANFTIEKQKNANRRRNASENFIDTMKIDVYKNLK